MTSAGGSAEAPREGYYPDPSIPGYVRYWDGTAWVPGTSRPQPGPGEELPPPPGTRATPAPAASRVPPRVPSRSGPASVEESGPMFLDEDPAAPRAQHGTPADPHRNPDHGSGAGFGAGSDGDHGSGKGSGPGHGSGDGHGSGGSRDARHVDWPAADAAPAPEPPAPAAAAPQAPAPAAAAPAAPASAAVPPHASAPTPFPRPARPEPAAVPQPQPQPQPQESGYGYPRTAPPATPSAPGGYGYPERQLPAAAGGYGYPPPGDGGGVPWQRQVGELARQDGPAAGAGAPAVPGAPDPVVLPWRPLASDPFASAAQPARPGGTGRRLAARVLDTLLVGAVVSAATYPLAMGSLHHLQHKIDAARLSGENVQVWLIDGTTGAYLAVLLGAMLLAGLLYEVLPTVKWGRTLGKKLFRLQVLDIESQITPGFGQALRRMLLRQVLDFVLVGVVNVAWCLFDRPWRQCWHDKVARTFVAADD
ncbi:RDD family protein [Streptantibioticus silvisoli]|uniref:RDD family protein n=1 Tax=Streptantibioticus silvisoli TaxID=2705255 RepID=UPI0027E2CB32|nr:RDD family protein [Streptantibioticus silvisoli]